MEFLCVSDYKIKYSIAVYGRKEIEIVNIIYSII